MSLDFSELLASAEFIEEARSAAALAPREVVGEGLVTWSVVIKVDEQLRRPGSSAATALVLHARETSTQFELGFIERLSRFAKPPVGSDETDVSELLRHDTGTVSSVAVPSQVAPAPLFLSTLLLQRDDLPVPVLVSPLLPIVVHPARSNIALLPSHWWGPRLKALWRSRYSLPN